MAAADSEETAPLLDGRYRLGECVGEGGMARVYRAEDIVLGRVVAIKLIRPGIDGASSDRARSEVAVLASLNHPSLVTLFDAHLVPGKPEYLAMEFVDGPTLGARLASGGRLAPDMVANLAAELAEALHVVHSAGVVHRDIKPSNVLLSPAHLPGARPRAKLADFGIAYLLDASRITAPGMVIGTVAYLAPEQIRGGDPAPASDIYSLGLVLLEALTGERAHPHGDGIAGALSRLHEPPAIPPSLDQRWAELLAGMLALEPSARPTAAQVVAATRNLTPSTPGAAAPAGTAATVPVTAPTLVAPASAAAPAAAVARADRSPGPRRKRVLAILGGAVAAAVAAVGVGLGVAAVNQGPEQAPQDVPQPALTVSPDPAPSDAPAEENGTDDEVVVDDPGVTDKEREKAEEAQRKAEERARKKAEQEQKKLEEEQRKKQDD